jgi:hypothetical protein
MPEFLIVLLVIPLLFPIVNLYLIVQRLLQIQFRYSQYAAQTSNQLPNDLKAILKPTIAQLQSLGFDPCDRRCRRPRYLALPPQHSVLCRSRSAFPDRPQ